MTEHRTALLDTLLPGDGADWPAAGAHGLAERMSELAAGIPDGAEALTFVLNALPKGFSDLVRVWEGATPETPPAALPVASAMPS